MALFYLEREEIDLSRINKFGLWFGKSFSVHYMHLTELNESLGLLSEDQHVCPVLDHL